MSSLKLWHCHNARSLRPLWALEELGLEYTLIELPFPPRVFQKEFLGTNVLGTVPFFEDGQTTMTESSAICQYLEDIYGVGDLSVDKQHEDYGNYLNYLYQSDATLTFPQTLYLRYSKMEPEERRQPQVAEDYRIWFLKRLARLNEDLESKEYLCANRFTMADIAVGYALFLGLQLGLNKNYESQTQSYLERLMARSAFARAIEKTSKDKN